MKEENNFKGDLEKAQTAKIVEIIRSEDKEVAVRFLHVLLSEALFQAMMDPFYWVQGDGGTSITLRRQITKHTSDEVRDAIRCTLESYSTGHFDA